MIWSKERYIHAITFAPFAGKGVLSSDPARESLRAAVSRVHINAVILVPGGLQNTPQSEEIRFAGEECFTPDEELISFIGYAHELGLMVFIKPTVNCRNGTWRAHISFFDEDVPCEPKWCNWFDAYAAFQCHYAEIAQKTDCEMFIAGCEMVMSEHREEEWRTILRKIHEVYHGPVSYNTDKYQEHNISWWDAVDVISSSGYYPINDWETQLDRIEAVVKKFDKPFFFAETGCMSVKGSSLRPNDWSVKGALALEEQEEWYKTMLSSVKRRSWIRGTAIWSWGPDLKKIMSDGHDYEIYGKPAEKIIADHYGKNAV